MTWPVLKSYDHDHSRKIALPVGGIGTGTISLGGRGNLIDWEIANSPAKGFTPYHLDDTTLSGPFFAIYTEQDGHKESRALEGLIHEADYDGCIGCTVTNHGVPRFNYSAFHAAYPFGQVELRDDMMPVTVKVKAFNPFIPGDEHNSSYPVMALKYEVTNLTQKKLKASVCGSIVNLVGEDPRDYKTNWTYHKMYEGSKNPTTTYKEGAHVKGLFFEDPGVDPKSSQWGNMSLTTPNDEAITYRTCWANRKWGGGLLDFWDDFTEDGRISTPENNKEQPYNRFGSLAVEKEFEPNETKEFVFLISWNFPNRRYWFYKSQWDYGELKENDPIVGNFYSTKYKDSWVSAESFYPKMEKLEKRTIDFVNSFLDSNLSLSAKEAALFNLSTIRTQTVFQTRGGHFFGWEGIHDREGSCWGSCTHVWNYEQATPFLFGEMAYSMRGIEFLYATDRLTGHMGFRVQLPLSYNKKKRNFAAADGQMGCIMKIYRDYKHTGDLKSLQHTWPIIKKTMEFCWLDGSWDADRDGVMEGCQHNTMDVEYYGPNPQMQLWYLGALKACIKMGELCGDFYFAGKCQELFEHGSEWTDNNLFNGEYYIQKVQIPKKIRDGITVGMGSKNIEEPDFQLGDGCLIDQLLGQYMANICGLGYLVNPENIKKTLKSIFKYNYKEDFLNHFNPLRSFALNDEAGVVMASYPKGNRPKQPFPYYQELMSGFEYQLAAHMYYEDMAGEAETILSAIRMRYDGLKRNPFAELECGYHYARAMASWAVVVAKSGFEYNGFKKKLSITDKTGSYFWSNGRSWGTFEVKNEEEKFNVEMKVLGGVISIKSLSLGGEIFWNGDICLEGGESTVFSKNTK